MFCSETDLFTDDVLKLGSYLESSIDISPAMTTKNLAENEQVLYRSTCRLLFQDEIPDKDRSDT